MPRRGAPGFSASRLRAALAATGLSPADLARGAGGRPSDISKYLKGDAAPQPRRLSALARALGTHPATLLDDGTDNQMARLRAVAGLTQAELCERAGIGIKHYEAAEAGRRRITPGDIARLSAALNLSAELIKSAHDRDVANRAAARSAEADPARA